MSTLIVRLEHLRGVRGVKNKPGFCLTSSRAWCEVNGIDWRDFCRNGVNADVLLATGDPLARRLVEHAAQVEEARNGQQ